MSKKIIWSLTIILLIIAGLATLRILSSEDSWICVDDQWIEHGYPSSPRPEEICGNPNSPASSVNPFSNYCIEQGGGLEVETRGDGVEFGVCYFMDNYQCETVAMLYGECPVGGLKVTGYITPGARYCAIRGGKYSITIEGGPETEQGTCILPRGQICNAQELWEGTCPGPG